MYAIVIRNRHLDLIALQTPIQMLPERKAQSEKMENQYLYQRFLSVLSVVKVHRRFGLSHVVTPSLVLSVLSE